MMPVSPKARLRNALKEGYLRENDVNRRLAGKWFLIEEEACEIAAEQEDTRPNPVR